MDKFAIQTRIAEITQQKTQRLRDLDALDGALQDCEYWLGKIGEKAIKVTEEAKGETS
jgi:5'-deoxynucleotidase YfbR-like HD superfamily hydrolase